MSATHKLLRFGVFELNLDTEELRKSGTMVRLAPQPLRLLAMLANRAGQIVTREEIQEQLWGDETYVDFEQGMNHCIKQIRSVLGDNADNPLYVETLPRRGYRFVAPVVSKNVLAPAPKVIKSTSGVQSGVLPAMAPDGGVSPPQVSEAPPKLGVAAKSEPAPSDHVVKKSEPTSPDVSLPVRSAEAVGPARSLALQQNATSATAAAEALAPEIARLRKSSNRSRPILAWIAFAIVLLVLGILYWKLHQP